MKKLLVLLSVLLLNFSLFAEENTDSVDVKEFLNVETHFIFEDSQINKTISNVYGATSFTIGDGLPISYKIGDKLDFFIEFVPSVLSEKKSALRFYSRHPDEIEIPVTIEITSKNSRVKLIDTKNIFNVEKEIDSNRESAVYHFSIKNKKEKKRYIKFEITGLAEGSDQIFITYGDLNTKIVDSSCDVFETVQFAK